MTLNLLIDTFVIQRHDISIIIKGPIKIPKKSFRKTKYYIFYPVIVH